MKISEHFELSEFTNSLTAKNNEIENIPTEKEIDNINYLVKFLLEPLRKSYGFPLVINSGFRSERLNVAVGGVATSQHTKGQAADVSCANPKKLLDKLKDSKLEFDQAILYPTFLHLSLKKMGINRNQIIIKTVALLMLVLSGCAKPIYLQGKTEYIEKIVPRDTTIFVEVEKQILQTITEDSSHLETPLALSSAKIDSLGKLHHTLKQKNVKIEKVVEYKEKIITVRDSIPYPQIIKQTKEVRHIPKIFWISMVVSAFFIGRIVYKIIKGL